MSYYLSADDLFTLVKSMTPGEKRYFRLQSRLYSGDKAYVRLFELLDRQQEFDEAAVKAQLTTDSPTRNFSVAKRYLFDHLVGALKNYGAYRDPDSDLGELIETAKVLEHKGMHRLAGRVLAHAKEKAYEDDAFLRLCYILIRQFIDLNLSKSDETMATLDALIAERKQVLEAIRNYSFIGDRLYLQRKMIRQMGKARDMALEEALRENIEPLMRMPGDQLLSRTAEGMYNMAMSDYFFATGDVKRALGHLSVYISKQTFPRDTSKIEIQHLNEFSNYFAVSLRSMHFDDFERHLDRFRKLISSRNTPIDVVIFERWLYFSITYLNLTGRFTEAAAHFREQADAYSILKDRMSKQTVMGTEYSLAYTFFGISDYNKALRHLLNVIDEASTDSEVYVYARLLSILVYYEMENWEALEYATRSTYRYLLKTERLFPSEKIILAFIRRLPSVRSNNELLDRFRELYSTLNALFHDSLEADIEYYFHIRAWLKSKVEGVDFSTSVKQMLLQDRTRQEGIQQSNDRTDISEPHPQATSDHCIDEVHEGSP